MNLPLAIPDLEALGINPHLHQFPDETAVHAVRIILYPDGAAGPHSHSGLLGIVHPAPRQSPEHLQFFPQTVLAAAVQLLKELLSKALRLAAALEVPVAS